MQCFKKNILKQHRFNQRLSKIITSIISPFEFEYYPIKINGTYFTVSEIEVICTLQNYW